MKAQELKTKTEKELATTLLNLKKEAMNLRFQKKTGELPKSSRIKEVRRDTARVLTVLNMKKQNGESK